MKVLAISAKLLTAACVMIVPATIVLAGYKRQDPGVVAIGCLVAAVFIAGLWAMDFFDE